MNSTKKKTQRSLELWFYRHSADVNTPAFAMCAIWMENQLFAHMPQIGRTQLALLCLCDGYLVVIIAEY